jgi:hypothetical protein
MKCQKCGGLAGSGDSFCRRCGHGLQTANTAPGWQRPPEDRGGYPYSTAMAISGVRSDAITMEVAECKVVPGETARFPFTLPAGGKSPAIREFRVISDNPNFKQGWAHVVLSTSETGSPRYTLEICPGDIRHSQYGTYPLFIYWGSPGGPWHAVGRCLLTLRPCIRLKAKPTLRTWPGGVLSVSFENCGIAPIDISISISHHGSNWSRGWEFELQTGDGPFEFSETFDPPADGRGGEFELDIRAEGISLISMPVQARHFYIPRKHIAAGAVVLAGAAVGTILTLAGPSPALMTQSISFTSAPPASPAAGGTYHAAATGGGSGNPVTFSIDPSSTGSACTISGSIVTFGQPGSCVIDANQAGNDKYQAAPQAQQTITVKATQSISISSTPPSDSYNGITYDLVAKGGGSGNPVRFSVDPSSASSSPASPASPASPCTVLGSTVTFGQPGTCVIDANQAGNDKYQAAPQAQQTITVNSAPIVVS